MKQAIKLTALFLAFAGCSKSAPVAGSSFDPLQFFSGRSHGSARLQTILGASRTISVDSQGAPDGHGGLVLDQRMTEQGKPPGTRQWILHPAGRNRWTGTLSEARGPVLIERTASDVAIRYRMKNSAAVEQHLRQVSDGSVENRMTVTRFGIRLADLEERIQKPAT